MASVNNDMTNFGLKLGESISKPPKHEMKPELKHKVLTCEGGIAQLFVSLKGIVMMNQGNGVTVDEYGTYLDGKINFGRPPSDFRIGGFWVFNDKMLTGLPSTLYTPIPTLVYSEPKTLKYIQQIIKLMSSIG